jgi:DNA polymerase I-like protein with 3'-5' exonuclease and polymerase domains
VLGAGSKRVTAAHVGAVQMLTFASRAADAAMRCVLHLVAVEGPPVLTSGSLHDNLRPRFDAESELVQSVYTAIELPLVDVLAAMELRGVMVCPSYRPLSVPHSR